MKIGYLCVAGSLGWGYYDIDRSDVDLRGVYYLTERDRCIGDSPNQRGFELKPLEVCMWSFDKFWKLLLNSNPTTIEWLLSPVIFTDNLFKELQKAVKDKQYNDYKLAKHYISMAKQNYKKYEANLTEKKQVYITRGIINARRVTDGELPIMDMRDIELEKNIDWWSIIECTNEYVEEYADKNKNVKEVYIDIFKNYYRGD